MPIRPLHILFCLTLLLTSCSLGLTSREEAEDVDIHVVRFDRAVEAYLQSSNFADWQRLTMVHPRETRILVEDELALGKLDDEHIGDSLKAFFSDSRLVTLRTDLEQRYAQFDHLDKDFTKAFSRLKKEYPEVVIPQIYTQVSALRQSIVVGDSVLGISLDKYLGADYPLYQEYYSATERSSMVPSRIVSDALNFYLAYTFPPRREQLDLSGLMIYLGKLRWVTSQLMEKSLLDEAAADKALRASYAENEGKVWQEINRPAVLHSRDSALVCRYMGFGVWGPSAKRPLPTGCGLWIGMRIVERYMHTHKDVTLLDLLRENNYEKIIRESGYAPK